MHTKTGVMVAFTNVIASEMKFKLANGAAKIQKPSPYQEAIFDFFREGQGNCEVSAVPGSGKTTTLIHAVSIMPWVQFDASTIHSAGAKMLHQYLKSCGVVYNLVESKAWRIVREVTKHLPKDQRLPLIQYALRDLLDFARLTGIDQNSYTQLLSICLIYDIPLDDVALELLPEAVELSNHKAEKEGMIDFTDMIYLPWLWNLPPAEVFDYVMVDESQDLNNMQWHMVRRLLNYDTGRLFIVGDPMQSMYLFAGASADTFSQISDLFGGHVSLPLSISYRCPSSHIELAQRINPKIQAWEKAQAGIIEESNPAGFLDILEPDDMVLCRFNAPLIGNCLSLIRQGRRAYVRGKGLHKRLLRSIDEIALLPGFEYERFNHYLMEWLAQTVKAMVEKGANESQIEATRDRALSLSACHAAAGVSTPRMLKEYVKDLFDPSQGAVQFATIHRAKGLEAARVHILGYNALPYTHPSMSVAQLEQEKNIKYVALTRSKSYLNLVSDL